MTTDQLDDVDTLGVINALERICELESRMRQAIQQTHPLTTTLDWDFRAADKEREALLLISEQLEYLEDKLRDLRFNGNTNSENKAVILAQLDTARRELLEALQRGGPYVTFGKDVLRDVAAFASVDGTAEDPTRTPRGQSSIASTQRYLNRTSAGAPAAMYDLLSSPKRPSSALKSSRDPHASPGAKRSVGITLPASRASTPGQSLHDNELWEEDEVSDHGYNPGQATRAMTLRSRRPPSGLSLPGEDQQTTNNNTRRSSSYARSIEDNEQLHFLQQYQHRLRSSPSEEDIGGSIPRGPSSSTSADDRSISSTPDGKSKRRLSLKSFKSLGRKKSGAKRDLTSPVEIKDEDIYGPPPLPSAESSLATVSAAATPRNTGAYGGVLRIKDMLERAEKGLKEVAEAQESRRTPARILGGPEARGDGLVPAVDDDDDLLSNWGGVTVGTAPSPSVRDWQLRSDLTYQASGYDPTSPRSDKPSGGSGVMGKLAGLVFVLGSIAAATMAVTALVPAIANSTGAHRTNTNTKEESSNSQGSEKKNKKSTSNKLSKSSTAKRGFGRSEPADMPPWADDGFLPSSSGYNNKRGGKAQHSALRKGGVAGGSLALGQQTTSNSNESRPHETPGKGQRTPGTPGKKSKGRTPVQNVAEPPSGRNAFPVNPPPDVSAVMG